MKTNCRQCIHKPTNESTNSGFTLIELIMSLSIIAVLVLLATPSFFGYKKDAEVRAMQLDTKMLSAIANIHYLNNKNWPYGNEIRGDNVILIEGDINIQPVSTSSTYPSRDGNYYVSDNLLPLFEYLELDTTKNINSFKLLEEVSFVDYIKSTKNELSEYVISINGKYEGEVFHLAGKIDKEGVRHHGILNYRLEVADSDGDDSSIESEKPDISVVKPVIPEVIPIDIPRYNDNDIEDLIKKGYLPITNLDDLMAVGKGGNPRVWAGDTKWDTSNTNNPTRVGVLGGKYVQVNDIDMTTIGNFQPIGSLDAGNSFSGTYDGGGMTIKNLTVDLGEDEYAGLFGLTYGATIKNIILTNTDIKGGNSIGGLIGVQHSSGTIDNIYVSGKVNGKGGSVGGLIGLQHSSSTIKNAYVNVQVDGKGDSVGGLVGYQFGSGTIENATSTGNITGHGDNVGGIVGLQQSSATITNARATGNIRGVNRVGGLVGFQTDSATITNAHVSGEIKGNKEVGGLVGFQHSSSTIGRSYTTGNVTGLSNYVGGLVGSQHSSSTITDAYASGEVSGVSFVGGAVGYLYDSSVVTNIYSTGKVAGNNNIGGLIGLKSSASTVDSYYNSLTSTQNTSDGGVARSTKEMLNKKSYENWESHNVWDIRVGEYPTLRWDDKE